MSNYKKRSLPDRFHGRLNDTLLEALAVRIKMTQPNFAKLIDVQRSALFTHDPNGKMRHINEPGFDEAELLPAPRFFMSRSFGGRNIWSFRRDVPVDIVNEVEALCKNEPTLTDFATPLLYRHELRQIIDQHSPVTAEWHGPAYWIPKQTHLSDQALLITETNADVLAPHFSWQFRSRANYKTLPVVATVVDGVAVSICHCARITDEAAEAGVETAEGFRGRGNAGLAVARWATVIREKGLYPLYSTSWENKASQKVAGKLGCVLYGENWHLD